MGTIIAGAACIRTIERYETRRSSPQRSVPVLLWTLAACSTALMICCGVELFGATREILIATAYGMFALLCISLIHRFALRAVGTAAIAAPALGAAILLLAYHPVERGTSVPLAFTGASNTSLIALNERVLYDAPFVGTGAGTFAALAPIYRQAAAGSIFILLRTSLQRGRDSFYPAMGGSCLITLLLLAFNNSGLFGTASGLIAAAVIGLAIAQSKSRTAKL
jgi:hypothetical protein